MEWIAIWIIVALTGGVLADRKHRHGGLWFLICAAVPLAIIILIALPPGTVGTAPTKACPMCAERVLAAARICKHCRHEFQDAPTAPAKDVEQVIY
ncbi:MAG: hypothetical protein AB7E79_09670 [Rhodospirillaceae bacterium]